MVNEAGGEFARAVAARNKKQVIVLLWLHRRQQDCASGRGNGRGRQASARISILYELDFSPGNSAGFAFLNRLKKFFVEARPTSAGVMPFNSAIFSAT